MFVSTLFIISIHLCFLFFGLYLYLWHKFGYWKRHGVDCVEEPTFPFGNLWTLLKCSRSMNLQFSEFYKKTKGRFGGLYFVQQPALILKDPEIIKHVLVKDFSYFTDRGFHCNEEKEPLSGHLFRLNGKRWRDMRSKLSPAFTVGKLKMMFESMDKKGQDCEDNITSNSKINVSEHSVKFTADCIASVIFGIEVNSFTNPDNSFWKAVVTVMKGTYIRYLLFLIVVSMPSVIEFLGLKSLFNKSNKQIFHLVRDVISYREKNKIFRNDFMQLMIQLKNQGVVNEQDNVNSTYDESLNSTEGLSIYKISASVYTMFFAGFDTSANTITFCLYHLALNPEIQNRVLEDIDKSIVKHNGKVTYESLPDMSYLEMVINETLRIYPILGYITRQAIADYRIPDTNVVIKSGQKIYISLLGLHHDPENFINPEKFDPERFSPENKSNIRPYTYLPFGDGPRNCIGKKLGLIMTTVGIVWFLKKHRVEICEETVKELKFEKHYLPHVSESPIILKVTERIPNYDGIKA